MDVPCAVPHMCISVRNFEKEEWIKPSTNNIYNNNIHLFIT